MPGAETADPPQGFKECSKRDEVHEKNSQAPTMKGQLGIVFREN